MSDLSVPGIAGPITGHEQLLSADSTEQVLREIDAAAARGDHTLCTAYRAGAEMAAREAVVQAHGQRV